MNGAVSIYSYDENCKIFETTRKNKKNDEIKEAVAEKPIVSILAKYGFMTAPLIQTALLSKGHKNIKVEKCLDTMQKRGVVDKFTITHMGQDMPDNDVYVLSKSTRKELKKKKIYRYDMDNIPYILEHLVQAQWHVSVTGKRNVTEIMYNHKLTLKNGDILTMPSLIKYLNILKRPMYICALPVCRGKYRADLGNFIRQVIVISRYFEENITKYPSNQLVIICESNTQILEVSQLLSKIKETSKLFILYALDIDSASDGAARSKAGFNPLNILYRVTEEDNRQQTNLICIK